MDENELMIGVADMRMVMRRHGEHWHILLSPPAMVALASLCDDWQGATIDDPDDGDMEPVELALWAAGQEVAKAMVSGYKVLRDEEEQMPESPFHD